MLLEQVYELLKEQIIDRVYGPGDKLNIDADCSGNEGQFDVGS